MGCTHSSDRSKYELIVSLPERSRFADRSYDEEIAFVSNELDKMRMKLNKRLPYEFDIKIAYVP